jgi:hypothetical protein
MGNFYALAGEWMHAKHVNVLSPPPPRGEQLFSNSDRTTAAAAAVARLSVSTSSLWHACMLQDCCL